MSMIGFVIYENNMFLKMFDLYLAGKTYFDFNYDLSIVYVALCLLIKCYSFVYLYCCFFNVISTEHVLTNSNSIGTCPVWQKKDKKKFYTIIMIVQKYSDDIFKVVHKWTVFQNSLELIVISHRHLGSMSPMKHTIPLS
jgi:hypothetical protein